MTIWSRPPVLIMLQGGQEGRELALPQGEPVLGRSSKADIFVGGNNVSGKHARLHVSEHGTVVVEDLESTNGTWVNGDRLLKPAQLSDGDVVRLGDVDLRFRSISPGSVGNLKTSPDRRSFESGGSAPKAENQPRQRRRVVIIAGACEIVLAVISAASTSMSPLFGTLATAAVGILCALAVMFFEYMKERPSEASLSAATPEESRQVVYWMGGPRWMAVRERPGLIGIVAVVLVLGLGGIALASAANFIAVPIRDVISGGAGTNPTGNTPAGPAVERLSGERTAEESGLSLTVTSVKESEGVTRVEISVSNNLSTVVTLPVFANCQLSTADGQALEADPFQSNWGDSVPASQRRQGVIAFKGQLPNGGASATFSFIRVYGGPSVPDSLTVPDLILVAR